jgi:hypothetical protein
MGSCVEEDPAYVGTSADASSGTSSGSSVATMSGADTTAGPGAASDSGNDCTEERCDGIDNDCDDQIDEDCDCIDGEMEDCFTGDPGLAGEGECAAGMRECIDGAWSECEDEVLPTAETCNSRDDDCDGSVDEDFGEVTCGLGICMVTIEVCQDGVPLDCRPGPAAAAEQCNGFDDDCDGRVDEALTCDCLDGATQDCYTGPRGTEGVGACTVGTQTCVDGMWAEDCVDDATPLPEACDGIDNDCDSEVDEGDLGGGAMCSTGLPGVCDEGTTSCTGGAIVCTPDVLPSAEVCDGLNNDCDGSTDEGNPGGGMPCSTGQLGVCGPGTTQCTGGALGCNANVTSSPELCDGLDNDCDGPVDEGNPGGGAGCSTGLPGVCAAGTTQCSGGAIACSQNVMAGSEICDGVDNDCDGAIDQGNPGGGANCATGLLGACAAGSTLCSGGALVCTQVALPVGETCDSIDNDCDGVVDEGNPGGGVGCSTGLSGICATGTTACAGGTIVCNQTFAAVPETCDGLDNDCDGVVDEGNPGGGAACGTGLPGICAAGTSACSGGAVICSQNNPPVAEACGDALDNDCDGMIDEGCGGGCVQVVADTSFEGGSPNASWLEFSQNFGTPLCTIAGCGTGGGSGPRNGGWWAWLGGYDGYELASMTQTMVIPVGTATLSFWVQLPACANGGVDTMEVTLDGMLLFTFGNAHPTCDLNVYTQYTADVTAFANGGSHTLDFTGEVFGTGPPMTSITNFFVDDVSIQVCP